MDAYWPEFSAFWSGASEPVGERRSTVPSAGDPALPLAQEVALEELFERVNAARSVL